MSLGKGDGRMSGLPAEACRSGLVTGDAMQCTSTLPRVAIPCRARAGLGETDYGRARARALPEGGV